MKCSACGRRDIAEGARFCPACGRPLANAVPPSNVTIEQKVGKIGKSGKNIGASVGNLYGDLIVVSSLSELAGMDPATRRGLMRAYESKIQSSPQVARYYLALGLSYLNFALYSEAIAALSAALERAPQDANTLYYLALAHIRGRELRTLTWSEVRVIEGYLEAAVRIDGSRAHYICLWALIKYEYYLCNGFAETPPTVDELLDWADDATYDPVEIDYMFQHAPVPESPLTEAILGEG